jgi:formate/nitrite transporter FocA (FNT family)
MFIIPAAIFAGQFSWSEYILNFIPVFIGNAIGGSIFVALAYWLAYIGNVSPASPEENQHSYMRKRGQANE